MVDAGAHKIDLIIRGSGPFGQHLAGTLHRMAQAHKRAPAAGAHPPAVCRHRVDVVEQQCVRSQIIDIIADIQQHRDRAQPAEDPAGSERVAYALLHAILTRNFDIQGISFEAALLKGGDHISGVFNGCLAVWGSDHFGLQSAPVDQGLDQGASLFQATGIDIHQADGRILQRGGQQNIIAQVAGKNDRTCANQGNFGHC